MRQNVDVLFFCFQENQTNHKICQIAARRSDPAFTGVQGPSVGFGGPTVVHGDSDSAPSPPLMTHESHHQIYFSSEAYGHLPFARCGGATPRIC